MGLGHSGVDGSAVAAALRPCRGGDERGFEFRLLFDAAPDALVNGHKISCPQCGRNRAGNKLWRGTGNISGKFWSSIRWSAKVRNLVFAIEPRYAWDLFEKQDRKCVLTGEPIEIHRYGEVTASLDRIRSDEGYVAGNVQWVHKRINWMKSDMSEKDFIDWCKKVTLKSAGL
jgi:hypothetical protein